MLIPAVALVMSQSALMAVPLGNFAETIAAIGESLNPPSWRDRSATLFVVVDDVALSQSALMARPLGNSQLGMHLSTSEEKSQSALMAGPLGN